jgi:putative membrane protein
MTETSWEIHGRLSPLAIVLLARKHIGASLIPIVVVALTWRGGRAAPLLVALVLLGVLAVILEWRAFRYRVSGGTLVIDRGVVRRSTRVVPLDRIRSVDITATAIHRALGVVQVEVEAAAGGRDRADLTLVAVTPETAAALRDRLLVGRPDGEVEEMPPPSVLYRASPSALAVAGATSWRYVLAPLAVIGVLWNLAENVPGGVLEDLGDAVLDRAPSDAVWVALLAVGAFAAAVALGALGSLLVDWGFVLTDDGERLVATRGLLTRRAVTIDRARVRGVDVRDSPLRRPLRLVSVAAVAGGIAGGAGGRATLAPILDAEAATRLVRVLDPAAPALQVTLTPHPHAARGRRLVRAVGLPAAAAALAAAVGAWWGAAALIVFAAAGVPLALDRYRQLGHRFDGERLVAREGSLSRRWSVFDPAAVVAYDVRRSPGQARAGVCTLVLHLGQGVGSRRVLDCAEAQARELLVALDAPLLGPLADLPVSAGTA